MMDVSVIMINYNTFDLARDAIESIIKYTENVSYEIILVDNQSPDGSGERLCDYFGDRVIYIQSGGNLGTSKAFNLGLKRASGKYVLWINSDVLLFDNFIGALFRHMEATPTCGICGGNLLNADMKPMHSYRKVLPRAHTYRQDMCITRRLFHRTFRKQFSDYYNFSGKVKHVGYITGADMMVRASLFGEVGAFDEGIFMYAEETEFTYRVKRDTSYSVDSVPHAKMIHLEGASFRSGGFSERRARTMIEGNCKYMKKCYGEKEVKKYLKILRTSSVKYIWIYAILRKKAQKETYAGNRRIAKEHLREFAAFYASL